VSATVALADLTRDALAEVAPAAVLVIAFGAIEQHGHHLPLGTDFLIVDEVARRAARQVVAESTIVLAPTVPYGSSDHHLAVGGALSLPARAFEDCARGLVASANASGFRRVFVVNGHGGNEDLLRVAAQAATASEPLAVAGGAYWSLARSELAAIFPEPGLVPGHAGRFETSLVLALRPDLVEQPPARADDPIDDVQTYWQEDRSVWQAIDGYSDTPEDGSAEEGATCLELIAVAVAGCIADFDRATRDRQP
jgi:creatinine amidohydrolase